MVTSRATRITLSILSLKAIGLLLPLSQLTYTNNISGCIPEDLKDLVFLSKVIKVEGRNNLRRSCLINMAHLLWMVTKPEPIVINPVKTESIYPSSRSIEINAFLNDYFRISPDACQDGFEMHLYEMQKRKRKKAAFHMTSDGRIDQRYRNGFKGSKAVYQ